VTVIYRGVPSRSNRSGDAVVSERIEAGGDDRRGREVTQIVGAKRHCEGLYASAGLRRYCSKNHRMSAQVRRGPSAFSR